MDVVSQPLVLVAGRGSGEDSAQVVAVLAGGVEALPGGVGQVALCIDLCALQTNWRGEFLGLFRTLRLLNLNCFFLEGN